MILLSWVGSSGKDQGYYFLYLVNKDKKMLRKKHQLFQRAKQTERTEDWEKYKSVGLLYLGLRSVSMMIILWSDIPGIVLHDFIKLGWFVRKRSRILFSLLGFSCSCIILAGDFNLPHIDWENNTVKTGSNQVNHHQELIEIIEDSGMVY
jgi:hypothetical protein